MFDNSNSLYNPQGRYETNMYYSMSYNTSMYNTHGGNIQQNYTYASNLTYNTTDLPLGITIASRQQEEQKIEHYLQRIGNDLNIKKNSKASKIAKTKNALIILFKLNKKIENIYNELKSNLILSELEWQEKISIYKTTKCQILEILERLKDESYFKQLKKDIEKREKKRLREHRKRKKWKLEKLANADKRARLHVEADSWIRSKEALIEREKQEENLRKDADMILSDVRNKRNDARKYLGLLQELQNLRNIKINILKARGEALPTTANDTFDNIIDNLLKQWSALDKEYSLEEQGLKLTLKTINEEKIEKEKKNVFDEWENVLFGKKLLTSDQIYTDMSDFIKIRTAWDKFVSNDNDASPIPIGWIMPEKPQSVAWQKCLKNDTS